MKQKTQQKITNSYLKILLPNSIDSSYVNTFENFKEYYLCVKNSLPSRYSHAEFKDIPGKIQKKLLDIQIEKLIDKKNNKNGLYIYGDTGVGKTFIAYSIQLHLSMKGMPSAFIETYELLYQSINHLFQRPSTYSIDEVKKYKYYLILDDFGIDKLTDINMSLLTRLIDYRYKECLPTVFTSNFSPSQLIEKGFDDRIVSRLVEMNEIIEIKGKDKRIP
jgi:primosomal protein DnaI